MLSYQYQEVHTFKNEIDRKKKKTLIQFQFVTQNKWNWKFRKMSSIGSSNKETELSSTKNTAMHKVKWEKPTTKLGAGNGLTNHLAYAQHTIQIGIPALTFLTTQKKKKQCNNKNRNKQVR